MPEPSHKVLLCERTWFMVLLLVLLWPVGVALMWEEPKFPRGARIALSGLVPVLSIALVVVVALAMPGNGNAQNGTQSAQNGSQTTQNATSTSVPVGGQVTSTPSTVTQSQPATTDGSAPTTSISGVSASWTTATVTFTLSGSDDAAGTGVAATFYTLNGSSPTTYTKPVSISTQGTTTVGYYSVDKSGNAEPALSAQVLIDKTPPTLSISTNAKATYTDTATVTASSADTMSGIRELDMKVDKGAWTQESSVVVTRPGKHTIYARAYDNAGNWRSAWKIIAVYGAPTLAVEASPSTTGTIEATASILPAQKTTLSVLVQVRRKNGTKYYWHTVRTLKAPTGKYGTWGTKVTPITGLPAGKYQLVVESPKHGYYLQAKPVSSSAVTVK